jgi:O-antigen ligase
MGSPLVEAINHLTVTDVAVLVAAGILIVYCFLSKRVYALIFMLVLSASFVGTTIPVIDSIASLVRWLSILLLFLSGLLLGRAQVSTGLLLFWGYAFLGFVSLFRATDFSWQFQKSMLLLLVAAAIPIAYGDKPYKAYELSLVAIAVAATLYSFLNFVSLPSHLSGAARFSGFAKGAPAFALVLGGLLPFAFWAFWNAKSKVVRITCGLGFLAGIVALALSGQRAGTIAGVLGLLPLILTTMIRKKNIGRSLALMIPLFLLSLFFIQQTSTERVNFLLSRYRPDSGLSNRELIWETALTEISKEPFLGQGTGSAEQVVSSSFHNAYLEVWFNAGLLGLTLFVAAQCYFFYRIFYLMKVNKQPQVQSTLALALGYMLGFLEVCLVESTGAGASNVNVILYLFLGVLVSSNILFQADTSSVPVESRAMNSSPEPLLPRV